MDEKKSSLRLTPRIFFRAKLSDAAKMSLNPKYIAFNEIYFFQEDIRFCFVAFFRGGGEPDFGRIRMHRFGRQCSSPKCNFTFLTKYNLRIRPNSRVSVRARADRVDSEKS